MESKIIQSDVLIIGSGGAGARAAIEVSNLGLKPVIVSKGLSFRSGCTGMAEGGYNAAFAFVDPEDTKKTHFNDTLKGGSYLNDSKLVNILVDESPDRLIDLESYGALFDRQENGKLNQRPFGGQSYRRTCFAGDRTGHELITALKEEVIKRNIETIDEVMITKLILNNDEFPKVIGAVGLKLKDSTTIYFQSKSVILATGGAGQLYPVTSNTFQKNGDGYLLAKKCGHTIVTPRASIVPLEADKKRTSRLQGLSLRNICIQIKDIEINKVIYEDFGEMIFTHFGVGGPIILSASAHLLRYKNIDEKLKQQKIMLYIDLKPALIEEKLTERVLRDFNEYKNKDFQNSLDKLLPKKAIELVIEDTGIPKDKKVNSITREERAKLVKVLKNFSFRIDGFRPIEEAIVTAGGISTKEINPATMESKIVPNLYFAGEIIDVDAYTGGFNLQIAYSTGYTAGLLKKK